MNKNENFICEYNECDLLVARPWHDAICCKVFFYYKSTLIGLR